MCCQDLVWGQHVRRNRRFGPNASFVPPALGLADQALELVELGHHIAALQHGIEFFLTQRAQSIHHLLLDGAQHGGRLRSNGRIAGGEVFPADFGQRMRQARVQHLLEP